MKAKALTPRLLHAATLMQRAKIASPILVRSGRLVLTLFFMLLTTTTAWADLVCRWTPSDGGHCTASGTLVTATPAAGYYIKSVTWYKTDPDLGEELISVVLGEDGMGHYIAPQSNGYIVVVFYKYSDYNGVRVTFNMQGHGDAIPYRDQKLGETVERPDVPMADGFVFLGWYKNKACTRLYDFATVLDNTLHYDKINDRYTLTLYAKWLPPTSLTYEITSESPRTVTITGYPGDKPTGELVIPSSVTIGSNNYTVTTIGNRVFESCIGLTSVTIPASVTSIGDDAFYGCTGLTSVTIPASVTSIGELAFGGCNSLTSITIPASVTSIGVAAFGGCNSLTSITIPASVTSIGVGAFNACSHLASINVDENNVNYVSEDGVLFNKDKTTLIRYPIGKSGTSYTIPASVTSIGGNAFSDCGLTSVIIPASVTSIGNNAFNNCGLTSITIPASVTTISYTAFIACTGLTSVTIPASVTYIGYRAFNGCYNLSTVTLNSNASIGEDAFPAGATVTMNLTANAAEGTKWTTFYNDRYNFQADANTQVFKAELSGTTLTLHEVTDKIVNASTGVVLKTTGDGNPTMTKTTSASSNTDTNSLEGVANTEGATSDGTYYVLNYKAATGVGFYKLTNGKKLGLGKAYLTYNGASSRSFFGMEEETTSIELKNSKIEELKFFFDLSGRKVTNPKKGIYIHNGRKEVIR